MKTFFRVTLLVSAGAVLLIPIISFAHTATVFPPYWGPLVSCGPGTEKPMCTDLCDLIHTVQHTIYFGMSLALYAFAPAFFAWGGLMILISGGSPERLGTGKKILTGTVIGIAIVLGAFLIVNTFISVLGVGDSVGWGNISCTAPPPKTQN